MSDSKPPHEDPALNQWFSDVIEATGRAPGIRKEPSRDELTEYRMDLGPALYAGMVPALGEPPLPAWRIRNREAARRWWASPRNPRLCGGTLDRRR